MVVVTVLLSPWSGSFFLAVLTASLERLLNFCLFSHLHFDYGSKARTNAAVRPYASPFALLLVNLQANEADTFFIVLHSPLPIDCAVPDTRK